MKKIIKGRKSQFCTLFYVSYVETTIENDLELEKIAVINCPYTDDYCCKCGVNAYGNEDTEELEYRCPFAHVEIINDTRKQELVEIANIENTEKQRQSQKEIKVLMCKDWIIGELI